MRQPLEEPWSTCSCPEESPGRYVRLRVLGRGSQSIVYLARDEVLGRLVALKELALDEIEPADRARAVATDRFVREARLLASLEHPGIASVLDLVRRPDGTLVAAQRFIRGETLKAALQAAPTAAARWRLLPHVVAACHAVAYAHGRGVLHRDLKPPNLMVGDEGSTVLIDWGLAKAKGQPEWELELLDGGSDEPLGTPGYMSPEQARAAHAEVDERSDVFGLGAILYEVLTGRAPFEADSDEDALAAARRGAFTPVRALEPRVPARFARIAERALRPDPRARYQSAAALASDLEAALPF